MVQRSDLRFRSGKNSREILPRKRRRPKEKPEIRSAENFRRVTKTILPKVSKGKTPPPAPPSPSGGCGRRCLRLSRPFSPHVRAPNRKITPRGPRKCRFYRTLSEEAKRTVGFRRSFRNRYGETWTAVIRALPATLFRISIRAFGILRTVRPPLSRWLRTARFYFR